MNEVHRAVYNCDFCRNLGFGFTRPIGQVGFYKFPPTIGAVGEAPLLYIGINPRKSGNESLYDLIMTDQSAFKALSQNKIGNERYITDGGPETHYRPHMRIVQSAFGETAQFEKHAVVTELFFCATADSSALAKMKSPCANTYMEQVVHQVKPRLIVCVGKMVIEYLRWKFSVESDEPFEVNWAGQTVRVVRIIHPNDRDAVDGDREGMLRKAIVEAKALNH
jgi:hypothetical protein